MTIPDLRAEQKEVTLEHCSVLLEKMEETLLPTYDGDKSEFREICNNLDPAWMKRDLLKLFTEEAFLNLFSTQFGRGILVGSFIQKFVFNDEDVN